MQQPAAQLPWFHLCTLLDKIKDPAVRDRYAGKSLEHGWSRSVLAMEARLPILKKDSRRHNSTLLERR